MGGRSCTAINLEGGHAQRLSYTLTAGDPAGRLRMAHCVTHATITRPPIPAGH
jgi:hypothetical protein